MLDPMMQEFAAEMQAKAKRSRCASTRRSEGVSNLSGAGAQRLAQMIRDYWAGVGFTNVKTTIVPCGVDRVPTYGVRSNLRNGLPPAIGGHDDDHG